MKPFLLFGLLTLSLSTFGQNQTYLIAELSYPIQFHFEEEFRSRMGGTLSSNSIYENTQINIRPAIGFGFQKLSNNMGLDFNTQLRFLSGKAEFYDYFDGTSYDGEFAIRITELMANLNVVIPINEKIKIKIGGLLTANFNGVSFDGIKQVDYSWSNDWLQREIHNPPIITTESTNWNFPGANYGFTGGIIYNYSTKLEFYIRYANSRAFGDRYWEKNLKIQYIAIGSNYYFTLQNR